MNSYYAVERASDHLEHYGVKGMRWGVRKAITSGNDKALYKHYRKAAKKLAKLQRIGNNPGRSAAKAAAYGVAAAGTGTIAIGGTGIAAKAMRYGAAGLRTLNKAIIKPKFSNAFDSKGHIVRNNTNILAKSANHIDAASEKLENWGKKEREFALKRLGIKDDKTLGRIPIQDATGKDKVIKTTNSDLLRIGAAAATAGLAAKAAHNAYRARNAEKYRDKAMQWKNDMDEAFAGTRYEGHYERVPRRRRRRY